MQSEFAAGRDRRGRGRRRAGLAKTERPVFANSGTESTHAGTGEGAAGTAIKFVLFYFGALGGQVLRGAREANVKTTTMNTEQGCHTDLISEICPYYKWLIKLHIHIFLNLSLFPTLVHVS